MTFPPDLQILWQHRFDGYPGGHGERAGDVFLQSVDGRLHAIDIRDGSTRWIVDRHATIVGADADHVVLVPMRGTWGSHSLVGLSAKTGELVWGTKLAGTVALNDRSNPSRSSLLRVGDRAFIEVWRLPGVEGAQLWELDLATGEVRSTRPIPDGPRPVSDGRAIFATCVGRPAVWMFDGQDEREIDVRTSAYHVSAAGERLVTWHKGELEYRSWDRRSGALLHAFPGTDTLPAVDDELLVAPLRDHVVAWDLATGRERWRTSLAGSRMQRECTFVGEYVANYVALGHLLRRSDGAAVVRDEPMTDPRVYDDATLWVRERVLYRVARKGPMT